MLSEEDVKRDLELIGKSMKNLEMYTTIIKRYEDALECQLNDYTNDMLTRLRDKITRLVNDTYGTTGEYITMFSKLNKNEQRVLVERYVNGKTIMQTAMDTCYSTSMIAKISKRAIRKLTRIQNEKKEGII